MSKEGNKRLVRRYYEEVAGSGDVDRIADFISPAYVEVHDNTRHPIGIEGAKAHIASGHQTYSSLRLTVERQIAEGDWVATQVTIRGIHSGGTWMGIRPTGKPIEFSCVNLDKVVDGRIVEHGGAANMLEPLLKIGAIQMVGPKDD